MKWTSVSNRLPRNHKNLKVVRTAEPVLVAYLIGDGYCFELAHLFRGHWMRESFSLWWGENYEDFSEEEIPNVKFFATMQDLADSVPR